METNHAVNPTLDISSATDREIEAAVAEHCAGWEWVSCGYHYDSPPRPRWLELVDAANMPNIGCAYFPNLPCTEPCNRRTNFVPHYLTDANAVLALLDSHRPEIHRLPSGWEVWLYKPDPKIPGGWVSLAFGVAPTFCRAACIALLKAAAVTVKE